MGLSCGCEWEPEPGDIVSYPRNNYSELSTTRRKPCCSCKKLIPPKSIVLEITRFKVPDTDVECRIYGEDGEIPRASHYLCERCADIFLSLEELGFCVHPGEDQRDLLADYHNMQAELAT